MKDEAWKSVREAEEKSLKIMGAQNEVCDLAIRANAELEQVNSRLASLAHHYEQLSKRSDELKDEGLIQVQIVQDLRELCLAEEWHRAIQFSNIVESAGRYELIGILNQKAWDEDGHDWDRVSDIKAALDQYEKEFAIPF
jgi:trans-aconitate methyltransferase